MGKETTRICQQCSLAFSPKSKEQRFCSRLCSSRSASKHCLPGDPVWADIDCKTCGKRFRVYAAYLRNMTRGKHTPPGYCSRDCYCASRRLTIKPDERTCTGCGHTKPFTPEFFPNRKRQVFGLTTRCRACIAEYARINNIRTRQRLRQQVLTAYGGGVMACTCCKDTNAEFLTLDHIDGGGAKERKTLPGTQLYAKLRRQGFPQGKHRTLCFNCNWSFGHYGYCPHQKKSETQSP